MNSEEIKLQARKALERRWDIEEAELRATDNKEHPDYIVRGDAIAIGCAHVAIKQLKKHPDWHCFSDVFLRRNTPQDYLPYGKVARFESTKTRSKFWNYYQRLRRDNLPEHRIVFYPDDEAGLQFKEISPVLEDAEEVRIARLEVALDFGRQTGVDSCFIRKYFISGKCKHDSANSWGRRNGTKFIRSYFKKELGAHRLELQLNWRFVRKNRINDLFDIGKLAKLLPDHHILFAEIDEQKVIERLRAKWSARKTVEILSRLHSVEGDLLEQLELLRDVGHLKNTRRLLKNLPINQRITEALKKWAAQWPTDPSRLARKP